MNGSHDQQAETDPGNVDRIALPARPAWAETGPGQPSLVTAYLGQLNLGRLFARVTIAGAVALVTLAIMVAAATAPHG